MMAVHPQRATKKQLKILRCEKCGLITISLFIDEQKTTNYSKRLVKRFSPASKPRNLSIRQSIIINADIINLTHKKSVVVGSAIAYADIHISSDIERIRVCTGPGVIYTAKGFLSSLA